MTQYINIRCIDNIDSIDNFIHPSIGPSVHLFLYLSICASICLCIYISMYTDFWWFMYFGSVSTEDDWEYASILFSPWLLMDDAGELWTNHNHWNRVFFVSIESTSIYATTENLKCWLVQSIVVITNVYISTKPSLRQTRRPSMRSAAQVAIETTAKSFQYQIWLSWKMIYPKVSH